MAVAMLTGPKSGHKEERGASQTGGMEYMGQIRVSLRGVPLFEGRSVPLPLSCLSHSAWDGVNAQGRVPEVVGSLRSREA